MLGGGPPLKGPCLEKNNRDWGYQIFILDISESTEIIGPILLFSHE